MVMGTILFRCRSGIEKRGRRPGMEVKNEHLRSYCRFEFNLKYRAS
jgi:hypothetical protein